MSDDALTTGSTHRPMLAAPARFPGRLLGHALGWVLASILALSWMPLAAQEIPFPALPGDARAGKGEVVECDVGQAEGTARCGVFRVWEDRDAAEGRTVDIHFVILDATDPTVRTDEAVLFFFGGPGVPVAGQAAAVAEGFAGLRRSRDLLMVELRGVGPSNGLGCDVPYPDGFESRFGTIFDTAHLAACRDALARRADLTQYTTPISVDDLEELRLELGYGAVSLFGGSYGTRIAQVYMRRHPDAVRAVVMNGVTPVSEPGYVRTSPNLQKALELLVRECGEQPECDAAYPDLGAQVGRAFARFEDGPVTVEVRGRKVPFHAADLGYALRGLLYTRAGDVPYRIAQAARGELQELAEYYVQRTDWVSSGDGTAAGNHLSVICAEDIRPVTEDDVRAAAAGTFLRGHVILSYRAACDVWPDAELPADFFEPVRSEIPTLLVSGERDPVTPPAGAETVAATLSHSRHVVIPNGGHGNMTPCIIGMVTRFVEAGSLDAIDSACVAEAPATEFRLP